MTRLELAIVGAIVAIVLVLAVSNLLPWERLLPAEGGTVVAQQSQPVPSPPARIIATATASTLAPLSQSAPPPMNVEEILPAAVGERIIAMVRLRNGELMSVSAGTTIGDDIMVEAIDSYGLDIRSNGVRMRLSK